MDYPFSRETAFRKLAARIRKRQTTKSPRTDKPRPRGKCLTNMDLALAAREPSPPDRPSHGLQLARVLPDTQTFDPLWVPPCPFPARARFYFAARTHRERIHSVVLRPHANWSRTRIDKLHTTECQQQRAIFSNGGLFRMTFLRRKQHVAGLLPFSSAFFHVQNEVVLQYIVIS